MADQVVLGLDFGGSTIAVALCDLGGARLAEASVQTVPSEGARWNLELGVAAAQHLLRRDAGKLELIAIGAATFGTPRDDHIELARAIPEWGGLALRRELQRSLDCAAVRVVNDFRAAASAEARHGALRGWDPALYLNLGNRPEVGLLRGGAVVSGGGSGGIVNGALAAPGGKPPRGDAAGASGLSTRSPRLTGVAIPAAERCAAEAHHPGLGSTVAALFEELAPALADLVRAIAPRRIAVGGGMVRSWSKIRPVLTAALGSDAPELVLGAYPYDAPLVGALLAGLEEAGPGHHADA